MNLDHVLAAPKTQENVKAVTQYLMGLTVKQLNDLKRERGVKASGLKSVLVAKIADRLTYAQPKPEVNRIEGYERRSGVSWLSLVVGLLPRNGLTIAQVWVWLIEGRYHDGQLRRILEDASFARDYGTMTVPAFKSFVARVKNDLRPVTEIMAV